MSSTATNDEARETKEASLNPNDQSSRGMALAVFLVFVSRAKEAVEGLRSVAENVGRER
jgi:hypothetical protein